jgi:hypothetical protein
MSAVRGHPFQLYYHMKERHPTFFLAPNNAIATKEHDGATPVKVTILIKLYGHKYTHTLLRKYGSSWVCREGGIYYRSR